MQTTTGVTMTTTSSPWKREYARSRLQIVETFGRMFDEWSTRAAASVKERESHQFTPADFFGTQEPTQPYLTYWNETIDRTFELAKICRRHVTSELWVWSVWHRRRGTPLSRIEHDIPDRIAAVCEDTLYRKWRAGLGVLGLQTSALHSGTTALEMASPHTWVSEAWRIAVAEEVPQFLAEFLLPALDKVPARSGRIPPMPISHKNRDAVDRFIQRVFVATGEKILRAEISLVAGYQSPTELKRYQRGAKNLNRTAKREIERVLSLSPPEFLKQLHRQ